MRGASMSYHLDLWATAVFYTVRWGCKVRGGRAALAAGRAGCAAQAEAHGCPRAAVRSASEASGQCPKWMAVWGTQLSACSRREKPRQPTVSALLRRLPSASASSACAQVFAIAPPTAANVKLLRAWQRNGEPDSGETGRARRRAGDLRGCFPAGLEGMRVAVLGAGASLLIPSGWIHAVVTSADSCVFGFNFHTAAQLETALPLAVADWGCKTAEMCAPRRRLRWLARAPYRRPPSAASRR
jgi:hypothetical protein